MNARRSRIEQTLRATFAPTTLLVEDDSASHAGHAGASAAGQTHFNVVLVADRFAGLSRVARHRLVTDALAAEFASGLHALSLVLRTPAEADQAPV